MFLVASVSWICSDKRFWAFRYFLKAFLIEKITTLTLRILRQSSQSTTICLTGSVGHILQRIRHVFHVERIIHDVLDL